jgi:hypothetical protein
MDNLNLNGVSTSILKSEFNELIEKQNLEVFTQEALAKFVKEHKETMIEKGEDGEDLIKQLNTLTKRVIMNEKGEKEIYYTRSIYDLEKAEKGEEGDEEGTERNFKNKKFKKNNGKWWEKVNKKNKDNEEENEEKNKENNEENENEKNNKE